MYQWRFNINYLTGHTYDKGIAINDQVEMNEITSTLTYLLVR